MKTNQLLMIGLASVVGVNAFYKGFNLGATLPDGSCRTESDWEFVFSKIASFPGEFRQVRLYASSDCDTLVNAVPAAITTNTSILVGISTQDDSHFDVEKGALLESIQQYGTDWILAVSVGSEDLYRKEVDPNVLAQKIYDVRGMIGSVGAGDKLVGHVDTWNTWVDPLNTPVIQAVDWIGNDVYPFWQGVSTDDGAANSAYWEAVNNVRAVAQGKEVWTTNTGSPINGDPVGNAVPSIEAAQTYWWQVSCQSFQEMNYFWYDLDDFNANPQFALVDTDYNPVIDMACS